MIDETAIARIAAPEASLEQIAHAIDVVAAAKARVAEADRLLKSALLEHIEATGRPIVIGDIKYYAGTEKKTVCRDAKQTLEVMLANQDLQTVADCLSANAWKPGAARLALPPEAWDECFTVEERPVLKEGKPTKKLLTINTHFLKGHDDVSQSE